MDVSKMRGFFITGTDTEIGKTYVTCALLRDLRERGFRPMGYKPVACGDRNDPRAMRIAAGESSFELEKINPVYLRAAVAPSLAAELEQRSLRLEDMTGGLQLLADAGYDPILVEGAGGWEAPLTPGKTMADLAVIMGLPVVLVVGNKLGAVNHAVLTMQGIRARGLECRGVVLNQKEEEWDAACVSNRRLIEEYSGMPVLAELICGQQDIDSRMVLGV